MIELDPAKVSPQTHTFLGMYRPPFYRDVLPTCPRRCYDLAASRRPATHDCWLAGHFDIPQWKLIQPDLSPFFTTGLTQADRDLLTLKSEAERESLRNAYEAFHLPEGLNWVSDSVQHQDAQQFRESLRKAACDILMPKGTNGT